MGPPICAKECNTKLYCTSPQVARDKRRLRRTPSAQVHLIRESRGRVVQPQPKKPNVMCVDEGSTAAGKLDVELVRPRTKFTSIT